MSFHQLSLIADGPTPGRTRRGGVQRTSVLAYQQVNPTGRIAEVMRWLQGSARRRGMAPTSMEIYTDAPHVACEEQTDGPVFKDAMSCLLYVRIGLSDAKARGLVENGEKRPCSVSGKLALTWKVRTR